ncbi:MAG: hypothetical protein JW727_05910 [Candidatus Aenigmarchaeota archaeon]|nr:hypothetical protein [Candidatus Aenigmarchaeota archaeon]
MAKYRWEKEADPAVLEFGKEHLNTVVLLDTICGGAGPYGKSKGGIFDSYVLGERHLKDNSPIYSEPAAKRIRELSGRGESSWELCLRFAEDHDPLESTDELLEIAGGIENYHKRQVRLDDATSLATTAKVKLDLLGLLDCPSYEDILKGLTGLETPPIPTNKDLDGREGRVLELMGCQDDDSLVRAAANWRCEIGSVEGDGVGVVYRKSAKMMLDALKTKEILPKHARLDIEILEKSPSLGTFHYGNATGDLDYGKTAVLKSSKRNHFDLVGIAAHEVGGHYPWHHLNARYAKRTGDLFGATGTIATNSSALNEGFACSAADIFREDVLTILERVSGRERAALEEDFEIWRELKNLNTGAQAYALNGFFTGKMSPKEIEDLCVGYGQNLSSARGIVQAICCPEKIGKDPIYPICYGSLYYPGQQVVEKLLKEQGGQAVIDSLCGEKGPASLSTLYGERRIA